MNFFQSSDLSPQKQIGRYLCAVHFTLEPFIVTGILTSYLKQRHRPKIRTRSGVLKWTLPPAESVTLLLTSRYPLRWWTWWVNSSHRLWSTSAPWARHTRAATSVWWPSVATPARRSPSSSSTAASTHANGSLRPSASGWSTSWSHRMSTTFCSTRSTGGSFPSLILTAMFTHGVTWVINWPKNNNFSCKTFHEE